MGCHTWFYKKIVPQPTHEDIKLYFLNHYETWIKKLEEMSDEEYDEEYNNEIGVYKSKKRAIRHFTKLFNLISKDKITTALYELYSHNEKITKYINGIFYISDDSLPHDLFRIYGYKKDTLLSLEQTLNFIVLNYLRDNFKADIIINWKERLIQFWKDYPDGMINFG
jgi:hypothetical protein